MTVTFPSADSATFEPNVDSVRRARRLIRDVVSDAGGDADAAELLTAELATNAVMHASTTFTIRWERHSSDIRVEVMNHAPEMIVALMVATDDQGRGLAIVDQLSQAWGVETKPDSKSVWFELATPVALGT